MLYMQLSLVDCRASDLTRTVPNICDLLASLEYAMHQNLLPALTGRDGITDTEREHRKQEKEDVERVRAKLPVEMQTAMSYSGEKGASQWLGVLPLTEYGFSFHKGAFQDALALHYRWTPRHVPSQCACGKRFTVEHAFSCPYGGFPFL